MRVKLYFFGMGGGIGGPCKAGRGGGAARPGAEFYISEARRAGGKDGLWYLVEVMAGLVREGK